MKSSLLKQRMSFLRHVAIGALAIATSVSAIAGDGWFTTWAGPAQDPGATGSTFPANTTIREAVWGNFAADSVRVKFSNLYGTTPLVIGTASIGIRFGVNDQVISQGTLKAITFGGKPGVSIPAGGVVLSDTVA